MKVNRLIFFVLAAGVIFFTGCATTSSPPAYRNAASEYPLNAPGDGTVDRSPITAGVRSRSGLATSWGEDRDSQIGYTDFSRGGKSRPYGSGKIFYNDDEGARSMADRSGFSWTARGPVTVADRTVAIGLKNSAGSFLKSYASGGDRFFVGEQGGRYQIYLKNLTGNRIEVVVSVDGLDVMDGKSASVKKRGYLIRPHATLTIEGFRQSESTVAAFRFGSVSESYAARKHGDTRNVGVVGVAVWTENGNDPFRRDATSRRTADPFPASGRFATPPD